MALIKCSDCGKEISGDAVSCIYCGKPSDVIIESNKIRNSFASGTIIVFRVIIIIMASFLAMISLMFHSLFGLIVGGLLVFFTFKYTKKFDKIFKK